MLKESCYMNHFRIQMSGPKEISIMQYLIVWRYSVNLAQWEKMP